MLAFYLTDQIVDGRDVLTMVALVIAARVAIAMIRKGRAPEPDRSNVANIDDFRLDNNLADQRPARVLRKASAYRTHDFGA